MTEKQLATLIHNIIPKETFQTLCGIFLEDMGYAQDWRVSYSGITDKGRDFYGTKSNIRFEAHCKAGASPSSNLREAILIAGKHHQEANVRPPDRIILFSQDSIASHKKQSDPDKINKWKTKIIETLQNTYSCYDNHTPDIQLWHSGSMASKIDAERSYFKRTLRYLASWGQESQSVDLLFEDDHQEESAKINEMTSVIKENIQRLPDCPPATSEYVINDVLK
jgi:hypothetical protein